MQSLILIKDLGIQLDGKWIFRNISFYLQAKELLVLEGASGSGKSTLLKSLIGLTTLKEGQIHILDKPFDKWRKPDLRKMVFFLQQESPLYASTVLDQLKLPFSFQTHKEKRFDLENATRLFSRFGKDKNFLEKLVKNLSGGEKQICAFIRSLLLEPQILLLDEPSSSMDRKIEKAFEKILMEWIEDSSEKHPRSVILTSHNSQQLDRLAHRRIQMEKIR